MFRLALVSCLAVFATADVSCDIGTQWVKDFIKFECYTTATIAKGVRPIGCVPTNDNNGVMIQQDETHDETHFRYACNFDGTSMTYQINNCFDSAGKMMEAGETRDMPDFSTVSCYRDGALIKKKVDKATGCKVDGKAYASGEKWVALFTTAASVQAGMAFQCVSSASGVYAIQSYGCVGTDNKVVLEKKYSTINDMVVQCTKNVFGDYELDIVDPDTISCKFEDKVYQHFEEFDSKAGDFHFRCEYGVVVQQGCYKNGKLVKMWTTTYFGDIPFYCATNLGFTFTDAKGCTLPDGTFKKFGTTWETTTASFTCKFTITKGVADIYVEQTRCKSGVTTMTRDQIILIDNVPMKCAASEGHNMAIRLLTDAEMAAYLKSKSVSVTTTSDEFSGTGGSGSGAFDNKPVEVVPAVPVALPEPVPEPQVPQIPVVPVVVPEPVPEPQVPQIPVVPVAVPEPIPEPQVPQVPVVPIAVEDPVQPASPGCRDASDSSEEKDASKSRETKDDKAPKSQDKRDAPKVPGAPEPPKPKSQEKKSAEKKDPKGPLPVPPPPGPKPAPPQSPPVPPPQGPPKPKSQEKKSAEKKDPKEPLPVPPPPSSKPAPPQSPPVPSPQEPVPPPKPAKKTPKCAESSESNEARDEPKDPKAHKSAEKSNSREKLSLKQILSPPQAPKPQPPASPAGPKPSK